MKRKMSILMILISIFSVKCTTTKKIQRNMNLSHQSLKYDTDSITSADNQLNVTIDTIITNPALIENSTQVVKTGGWYLPIICYHRWKLEKECRMGASNIKQDIPTFLENALTSKINSSSSITCNNAIDSDYELRLYIDTLDARGPYINKGYYFYIITGFAYAYKDIAGPAKSELSISYSLVKDSEIILENSLSTTSLSPVLSNEEYGNIKILQNEYIISMVDATSQNFDTVITGITQDIIRFLEKTEPLPE